MVAVCHACGREFSGSRGLNTHLRFCKETLSWNSQLKRCIDDKERSDATKRARTGASVDLEEPGPCPSDSVSDSENGPELAPSPDLFPVSFSFSGCKRKVPRALKDYLPHSLAGLAAHLHPAPPKPKSAVMRSPTQSPIVVPAPEPMPEPDDLFMTETNGFGLYRKYTRAPRVDPEDDVTLESLSDLMETPGESVPGTITEFFHPFLSATAFRLVKWFYDGSAMKSKADLNSVVRDVIWAEDFNREDVKHFSADREMARLDEYGSTGSPFLAEDGWKEGSVKIRVPNVKSKHVSESVAPAFEVGGVHYRPLLEVIKSAYKSPDAKNYHWVPFKLFHQSPEGHVRVYSDIYNSNAMLEEDAKVQALPRDPGDPPDAEVAIAPILVWSDSTHLTNFGTASLWPIYIFFGNLSKYIRGKPTTLSAHHLAYIPSVRFILI